MGSSMLTTAATCLLLLLGATAREPDDWREELVCPTECTCHQTPRSHVPIVRWHETGDRGHETQHHWDFYHHHQSLNHTADHDLQLDLDEEDDLVLSAVCVLQRDTDASGLLAELPADTQFLSLLQAPDMRPTYLRAAEFSGLPRLHGLEIQGFHQHDEYEHDHAGVGELHGNDIAAMLARADRHRGLRPGHQQQPSLVTLSEDALQQLRQLRYVNLEYVLLSPEQTGRGPQYRSQPAMDGAGADVPTLLVEQEPEVVPYEEFRLHTAPRYSNFANLTQLRFLRVAHAGLEEVTWELFQGLPELEHLIVEHQPLTTLPDFAFYGCPNLRHLSLANNQLTIDMKSLAGLLDLEILDLSNNLISQLTYLSLAPFPHLRELNLLGNPTDLVYPGTFDMMNQTEVLRLGGADTPLTLMPRALDQLTRLRELTVASLSVPSLGGELFSALPELVSLEIHGDIGRLEFDAFSGNTYLERLDLSNCSLHEISQDALLGLKQLTVLDLSHNHLAELPSELFSDNTALREIYLHHNQLTWLSPQLLAPITPKLLQLNHNVWDCSCELAFLSATVTNKARSSHATICRWDNSAPGGRLCEHEHRVHLRYDARVEPRCHTPPQYHHWGLYEVLKRELRCGSRTPPAPATRLVPYHPVNIDDPDYVLEVVAADDVTLLDDRIDEPEEEEDADDVEAQDYDPEWDYEPSYFGGYDYEEYSADDVDDEAANKAGPEDAPDAEDGEVILTAHGDPTQAEEHEEVPYATISPELFAKLSRKAQKLELERMNPKFRKHYKL